MEHEPSKIWKETDKTACFSKYIFPIMDILSEKGESVKVKTNLYISNNVGIDEHSLIRKRKCWFGEKIGYVKRAVFFKPKERVYLHIEMNSNFISQKDLEAIVNKADASDK
ncbi:Uncharacterised protein [uncultured archaeon]|nr:Uncharacterised protein [uncultured archaeon]